MEEEKKEPETQPATEENKKPETTESEKKPEIEPSMETFEKKPEIKVAERQEPSERKEKPEVKVTEPEVKVKKPKFKVEMPKMKAPKVKFSWKTAAIVAIILLIISLLGNVILGMEDDGITGAMITSDEAGDLALGYVNSELINPAVQVDLSVDAVEEKELYFAVSLLLETDEDSQELEVYVSKNGKNIFLGVDDLVQEYDTEEFPDIGDVSTEAEATTFPTSETPEVRLFVMSFCPFGTQAEAAMAPVYELLKDSVDFNVNFIVTVQGDDMESVQSLHGAPEAEENARQLCILEEYGKDELWTYLDEFATAYSNREVTTDNVDTEWKTIAESVDLDVDTIQTCFDEMAYDLTVADDEVNDEFGATGSPTLFINGQEYRGARTPEAYKTAICSAFEDAPEDCEETLTGAATGGATAGGGAC